MKVLNDRFVVRRGAAEDSHFVFYLSYWLLLHVHCGIVIVLWVIVGQGYKCLDSVCVPQGGAGWGFSSLHTMLIHFRRLKAAILLSNRWIRYFFNECRPLIFLSDNTRGVLDRNLEVSTIGRTYHHYLLTIINPLHHGWRRLFDVSRSYTGHGPSPIPEQWRLSQLNLPIYHHTLLLHYWSVICKCLCLGFHLK